MLSIDTNLLFYASQSSSPLHSRSREWLATQDRRGDILLSELMLAELYRLLRNPVLQPRPLSAPEAAAIIQSYRNHPRWKLVGFPPDDKGCHDAI